jgi:hypothetical protein
MQIDLNVWNVYIVIIINGIFTGLGVALGTYFANNHIVKKMELLFKKIKKKLRNKK